MFGAYVKSLREEKGISSKELAKRVGKAPAYVSQIENGRNKNPDKHTSKLILEILGLSNEEIDRIITRCSRESDMSMIKIKSSLTTKDDHENKCKNDAEEVFNLISSLPERTQELLKDMMLKN